MRSDARISCTANTTKNISTESPDIVALPENRRRHYLARIQEGWAA